MVMCFAEYAQNERRPECSLTAKCTSPRTSNLQLKTVSFTSIAAAAVSTDDWAYIFQIEYSLTKRERSKLETAFFRSISPWSPLQQAK